MHGKEWAPLRWEVSNGIDICCVIFALLATATVTAVPLFFFFPSVLILMVV